MESAALLKELDEIRKSVPGNPFIELYTARALLKIINLTNQQIYRRLLESI